MTISYTRRSFVSAVITPLVGLSGCSALGSEPTQTLILRNESEMPKEISVNLIPKSDSAIEPFQHTFSIKAGESIQRDDFITSGKYKYEVTTNGGGVQSGIWQMKNEHNDHVLVIELKSRNGKIEPHVVTVSH